MFKRQSQKYQPTQQLSHHNHYNSMKSLERRGWVPRPTAQQIKSRGGKTWSIFTRDTCCRHHIQPNASEVYFSMIYATSQVMCGNQPPPFPTPPHLNYCAGTWRENEAYIHVHIYTQCFRDYSPIIPSKKYAKKGTLTLKNDQHRYCPTPLYWFAPILQLWFSLKQYEYH